METSLWVIKHQPRNSSGLVGQAEGLRRLKEFIVNYKRGPKRAALVYGPVGCGKTAAVYALARELGLEVLEINGSDQRNAEEINSIVGAASRQLSLFSKGKLILVDEIDGISGIGDRGGIPAIAKLIVETAFPIILTSNNPWDKKFAPLRQKSVLIEFRPLAPEYAERVLENLCLSEGISYEKAALQSLALRSGGDLRGAINDLQMLSINKSFARKDLDSLSARDKEQTIMQALVKIFKGTDPRIALHAFDNVNEELDKCSLWVDHNLPREYRKAEDLARAYEYLARADVFNGRIRRWQHWSFLIYINALLSSGVAVAKDEKYHGLVNYEQTKRILKLWIANMRYQKRKSIAQKIAGSTHSSAYQITKNSMPFLSLIFKNSREQREKMTRELDLTDEEVEWLMK